MTTPFVDHAAEFDADAPLRTCSMRMCQLEASWSATSDYEARIIAIGPLSPEPDTAAVDLCERHAKRLVLPSGWERIDYDPQA